VLAILMQRFLSVFGRSRSAMTRSPSRAPAIAAPGYPALPWKEVSTSRNPLPHYTILEDPRPETPQMR